MVTEKELKEIINENFNITECIVIGQNYRSELQFFSTKGKCREINGFMYLKNCDCCYTLSDDGKIEVKKGDVVYLPPFYEYSSWFKNFSHSDIDGILVNLMFSDASGKTFYLSNEMCVFRGEEFAQAGKLFEKLLELNNQPLKNMAQIKSVAYRMLSYFGTTEKENKINFGKYRCISKGILYLENDIQQLLSIEEIAKMCHVTPTYFRRLFKEYAKLSPTEFRIKKKLEMAKELLFTSDMTITQICDYLRFENVSYFSRLFKKYEKETPTQYRNRMKNH